MHVVNGLIMTYFDIPTTLLLAHEINFLLVNCVGSPHLRYVESLISIGLRLFLNLNSKLNLNSLSDTFLKVLLTANT